MRILQLVAGEKWTGPAAVVFDQTAALVAAGVEAQYAFVAASPLALRLLPRGWARPLITHPRTPGNLLLDGRRLHDTILRENFDILHAHTTHDHALARLAAWRTRARVARTIHHLRHAHRSSTFRALFGDVRAFAFANREIAERFGAPGPILPPVVDAERFRPGTPDERIETIRRFRIPEGMLLAGTVGKMAAGRGYEEAIAAAAQLPSLGLVHVGHGERMPLLKDLAARLGSADRNFWTGYQEDDLPSLYRCWDIFVFAASGSDQGQRAILEAMASGLPTAAVDVPGVRDLMTDGEEGIVAADAKGLAQAVARLAGSEETRRRMGQEARRRALAFTADRFAEKAKAWYEGLMAEPDRGPRSPSVP